MCRDLWRRGVGGGREERRVVILVSVACCVVRVSVVRPSLGVGIQGEVRTEERSVVVILTVWMSSCFERRWGWGVGEWSKGE